MCPATKWEPTLKSLHDKLSCDVLDTLPLPLLLVAGSCARAEYEKTLQSSARRLTLILEPTLVLSFDLDFRAHQLRRMTAYIDHPAAMLFGRVSAANSAACLDATLNFYLWLIGKSHDPVSLQRRYMRFGKGLPPLTAPIAELDAAMEKELNEGRVLNEREYSRDFRAWAEGFLGRHPQQFIDNGMSLALAVRQELLLNAKHLTGNAKLMPELRKKLLNGDFFEYSHMKNKNGSVQHRVYFRGVAIFLPIDASSQAVYIKCNLTAEGIDHQKPCGEDTLEGDPARRLGVKVIYKTKANGNEISTWYSQRGDKNTIKLNSLVDFLEGKGDAYTKNQPRRFLDRNKTRGRFSTSYTKGVAAVQSSTQKESNLVEMF